VASRRPDDRTPGPNSGESDTGPSSGRLRGADAFRLHLTLGAGLTICIAAFVIEVIRALDGNTLSWAYVFEWPIFAVFAVYMWWNLLHGRDGSRRKPPGRDHVGPDGPRAGGDGSAAHADGVDPGDADLLAWREYLKKMEADEARTAGPDSSGPE
jgi:hypothetical protein